MAKHGIENFTFEVIVSCKTQEDATEIENILMVQYESRNPQLGYNLVTGVGYGGHSESTKQKQSEATKRQIETQGHPAQGKKWTEEQKFNLSTTLKALDKDAIYTEEVRKNMSQAHIGIKDSEETKLKKAEKAKLVWDKRKEKMTAAGELKCNAPHCDVINIPRFYFVNGVKYCSKHAQRLKKTGSLELQG